MSADTTNKVAAAQTSPLQGAGWAGIMIRRFCAMVFLAVAVVIGGAVFADDGLSPLPQIEEVGDADAVTPLHLAVVTGDVAKLNRLIDDGVDVNAKDELIGASILHLVASNGRADMVSILVKAGADVNAKAALDGLTPLHWGVLDTGTDTALALVKAGADVNAKAIGGMAPLHLVAWGGGIDTARILIQAGGDLHIRGDDGTTPLDVAIERHGEDSEIVRFLRSEDGVWQKIKRWLRGSYADT